MRLRCPTHADWNNDPLSPEFVSGDCFGAIRTPDIPTATAKVLLAEVSER